MAKPIIVIGAGISGITTALTLQLLGLETACYAEYFVDESAPDDPRFSSLYPAASVIPHSVRSARLTALFTDSLRVFETLYNSTVPGVTKHRHFEIFEFPVETPEYVSLLENHAPVREIPEAELPRRPGSEKRYGWAFNCFIAEFPQYIHHLYQLYRKTGGTIHQKKLTRNDISQLPSGVIINCSGIWSHQLFEDQARPKIIRGHMLRVPNKSKVTDRRGRTCSYNYTPRSPVYTTPQGDPCDVYFYPVGDQWVLGGSRQAGTLTNDGHWQGPENEDTITIDKTAIPRQILAINREILKNTYQKTLEPSDILNPLTGYRFERDDSQNGLRLEATQAFGKTIIHNYGHGGAGVTLSWGCALQIADLMANEIKEIATGKDHLVSLLKKLQTSVVK